MATKCAHQSRRDDTDAFWKWVEDGIAAAGFSMLEEDGTRTGLYCDVQSAEGMCWQASSAIALSPVGPSYTRASLDACEIEGPEREAVIVVCEALEKLEKMARDLAELFRSIRPEKYKRRPT